MPAPMQKGPEPQLTTKTKTRTKAIAATLVVIVGLGIIAAVGAVRGRRAGVCDSGSRAVGSPTERSCRTNRDCRVAPGDRDAQCVRASTATSSRSTSRSSLPDLVVSSISPNPISGITTVAITNRGRGDASEFIVGLSAFASLTEGPLPMAAGGARTIESLAAGASTSISVMLFPVGGESDLPSYPSTMGYLKAEVDVHRVVTESDEANNSLTLTIPPPAPTPALPDLVIYDIVPNPITGITIVAIENRGRGDASAFNVSLSAFVSRTDDRLLVEGSARLGGLSAGARTGIAVLLYPEGSTLPGYPSMMGAMQASADASEEVTESDETNNVLIR